jgi:hypothetical protein
LYLNEDEMKVLILKMQEMMRYVLEKWNHGTNSRTTNQMGF